MQSFLGFVNFYGDFLVNATELTAQLYELTAQLYELTAARKGNDAIELSAENLAAFEEVKCRLCKAPQLAHPDLEKPFVLYTDASKIAVGAVLLLQADENKVERAV